MSLFVFLHPFMQACEIAEVARLPQLRVANDLGEELSRYGRDHALAVLHLANAESVCNRDRPNSFEPDSVVPGTGFVAETSAIRFSQASQNSQQRS